MKLHSFVSTLVTSVTVFLVCSLPAQAQSVTGQGTWETTLQGRDINLQAVAASSSGAVYLYDTSLNVTWLRDANVNGEMDWTTANTWAVNLVTGSGGSAINDWRLPTMAVNPNPGNSLDGSTAAGYNVLGSSSEMASLFYNTLGNKAYWDTNEKPQAGWGLTNTGSFQNMQSSDYWLGTEYAPNTNGAWSFVTYDGHQWANGKLYQFYALAVRPGDVLAPVPEPETYLMLLLGLTVLGVLGRRRSRSLGSFAA